MANRLTTIQGSTNPILSQFAKGYKSETRIARLVAPTIRSYTESGTYYIFGKEGFRIIDTERALRAMSKQTDFAISSTTYRCVEHALHTPLDYKEIEAAQKYGASAVLSLEQRAVNFVQGLLEIELEKAVADIMFSTTYYSGNYTTLTGDDQWSSANSDPLGQIKTGIQAARADMGIEPNTLVLGYTPYWALSTHAQIKAMISDNVSKPITVTAPDLANLLRLKNVYVGQAAYTTDAGVFTDLWGDYAALIYLPDNMEMPEGTTPHTVIIEEEGYPEVKTYQDKKVKFYEVTRKYLVKNIDNTFGYLITDLVA